MSEEENAGIQISQLSFETIENCGLFNKRAKGNGMVAKWAARNERGNAEALGNTKVGCMADARRYCKLEQESS